MYGPRIVTLPPNDPLLPDGSKAGGWWHDVDRSGSVVCDLCPRHCQLKPGDRGFCFVRENRDAQMVLTTYGRSTGFCIDPIEKKPLNHFYPGTSILSFGTAGCNLGCKFCQNHDISKAREVELLSQRASPETIAHAAVELGCRSVAFTYNDPIIWAEYAIDTARACRAVDIKSVAVTAGYLAADARAPFFEFFDAANVDLKSFSEQFYQHLTLSHLQPVLDTLQWLRNETDIWLEVTNLIIPNANDSTDELRKLCDWVLRHLGDAVPVHFSAFHPDFRMLDSPPTPHETLLAAYEIAKRTGLQYVYVGNVDDWQHQSTYCPNCEQVVIQRNRYELGAYHLKENECMQCGYRLPGWFDQQPGTWGRRRQRVRISDFALDPTTHSQPAPPERVTLSPQPEGFAVTDVTVTDVTVTDVTVTDAPVTDAALADDRRGNTMASPSSTGPLQLSAQQEDQILAAACEYIASAVTGVLPEVCDTALGAVGKQPIQGVYVSLKRQGRLRGCCGFIGREASVLKGIQSSARRTALEDVRLPPVSLSELEFLDVEVWLLQQPIGLTSQGATRAEEVVIGRDGLIISDGVDSGLLLPGVAVDNQWDATGFLRQVSIKANLHPSAWREDHTTVSRFEGLSVRGTFSPKIVCRAIGAADRLLSDVEFASLRDHCQANVGRLLRGAVPDYYLAGVRDAMVNGVLLHVRNRAGSASQIGRLQLRPAIPLQASLLSLCEKAAEACRREKSDDTSPWPIDMTILDDPAMHGTTRAPDLRGIDPTRRAIFAKGLGCWNVRFDPSLSAEQLLAATIEPLNLHGDQQAQLFSLRAMTSHAPVQLSQVPQPVAGRGARAPAVAGRFYSADPEELDRSVDEIMPALVAKPQPWRAALVPHAGLTFSGRIAAEVLSEIEIPKRVIVIGPKHTPHGAHWAVSPHCRWTLPGATVESDLELAEQLVDAIPDWQMDALAHRDEHAIEVELPLLHRLAPATRVVGVVVGECSLDQCHEFATGLAQVLRDRPDEVLIVISSDMNHYASDKENRRLDALAIEALETLDPRHLYSVVKENEISMCGRLPAVIAMTALNLIQPLSISRRVSYATSADVTGQTQRVVGYAGMLFR